MVEYVDTSHLFYKKYAYSCKLQQQRSKNQFLNRLDEIKKFLEKNDVEYKLKRNSIIDYNSPMPKSFFGSYRFNYFAGASLFFNDPTICDYIEKTYPRYLKLVTKVKNQAHLDELQNNKNIRIRNLFFKKYKFKIEMSRMQARHFNINLGEPEFISSYNYANEHGIGEVQEALQETGLKYSYYESYGTIRIFCNDMSIVTLLRIRYSDIITKFEIAKPIETIKA